MASPRPSTLILPSHPTCLVEDRFSLTDSTEDLVPCFDLLKAILASECKTPEDAIELLDTISSTIVVKPRSRSDYELLLPVLRSHWASGKLWTKLIDRALQMSDADFFPEGVLPYLTRDNPTNVLTRKQVSCLVVHQFLGTLREPWWTEESGGGAHDFRFWYDGEEKQVHPSAVRAYLSALLAYLSAEDEESGEVLTYRLVSRDGMMPSSETKFSTLDFMVLEQATTDIPTHSTQVVFSNKYVGFGHSATQEELIVGVRPEAYPIVLMVPPLEDDQVLVVSGARGYATIEGYGRGARLEAMSLTPAVSSPLLFMDALELDTCASEETILPDLLAGNVDRELNKAFTAFSTLSPPTSVRTGAWGCGAFGGNLDIKTLIQWCAASQAGVDLTFVCFTGSEKFVERFCLFRDRAIAQGYGPKRLLEALKSLPSTTPADSVLESVSKLLEEE